MKCARQIIQKYTFTDYFHQLPYNLTEQDTGKLASYERGDMNYCINGLIELRMQILRYFDAFTRKDIIFTQDDIYYLQLPLNAYLENYTELVISCAFDNQILATFNDVGNAFFDKNNQMQKMFSPDFILAWKFVTQDINEIKSLIHCAQNPIWKKSTASTLEELEKIQDAIIQNQPDCGVIRRALRRYFIFCERDAIMSLLHKNNKELKWTWHTYYNMKNRLKYIENKNKSNDSKNAIYYE